MDSARKKELRGAYKSKPVVGGVCRILCEGNQRAFLQATRNIEGLRNRFDFAMATGTCPDPSMRGEWERYGGAAFSFTVLEELRKGENQTDKDFQEDLNLLYEIWRDKLRPEG